MIAYQAISAYAANLAAKRATRDTYGFGKYASKTMADKNDTSIALSDFSPRELLQQPSRVELHRILRRRTPDGRIVPVSPDSTAGHEVAKPGRPQLAIGIRPCPAARPVQPMDEDHFQLYSGGRVDERKAKVREGWVFRCWRHLACQRLAGQASGMGRSCQLANTTSLGNLLSLTQVGHAFAHILTHSATDHLSRDGLLSFSSIHFTFYSKGILDTGEKVCYCKSNALGHRCRCCGVVSLNCAAPPPAQRRQHVYDCALDLSSFGKVSTYSIWVRATKFEPWETRWYSQRRGTHMSTPKRSATQDRLSEVPGGWW
jgi:hypothetical protein